MANEAKIAHLGFIQGVINRMGGNSFVIKGWTVTLVAAIFALSAERSDVMFAYLPIFPLIFFWWLDAFFLHQEKLYRELFKKVAENVESSDQFIMNTDNYKNDVERIGAVFFSKTLISFYGAIILLCMIFMWKILKLTDFNFFNYLTHSFAGCI